MVEQSRLWRLDAQTTTALLFAPASNSIPQIAWFGSKLAKAISPETLSAITDLPVPMAKLDASVPQDLFPQSSTGIDLTPALRGHRAGSQFAHRLNTISVEQNDNGIVIALADASGLAVELTLKLHSQSGVLSVQTTLTNTGDSPYTVEWIASATLPVPQHYAECLYLTGRWGLEFQRRRQPITDSKLLLENTRGRTSHELYPGIVAGTAGFDEQHGEVIAAQLAWSGSHRTLLEKAADGRLALQCGVALDPGELILEPGESYTTPALHVATGTGLNQMSQAMHHYARSEILPRWTRTERPIHTNSWEALYFDHDIEKLKALIDAAKALGAERFVLDDGWFPARRSDNAGLGDWWVDRTVYPEGLHPIVDHTRVAGMQFGLWFEPEMVNPDSQLYREHPEWVLQLPPLKTPLARNQLVLDLDNPQVADYLFDRMATLIDEYNIDYIKWDFNRDLVLAGNGSQSRMHKQPIGSYKLMERLNQRFANLEIESCSSGGARADWGVLKHTGRVWTSDSIDAVDRVQIQKGYSLFNPPEVMGAHVGHEEAHLTGRSINIHTRAIVALQGQLGFEVDARHLTADETTQLLHYVALYKKHRGWMAESTSWRLNSNIQALTKSGLVSTDKKSSLWFVIATDSLHETSAGKLSPLGLDPQRDYQVRLVSNNLDSLNHFSKHTPAWLANSASTNGISLSGAALMTMGLTLPVMPAQSALMLEITS